MTVTLDRLTVLLGCFNLLQLFWTYKHQADVSSSSYHMIFIIGTINLLASIELPQAFIIAKPAVV